MALTKTQLNRLDGISKLYTDDKVSNITYDYTLTTSSYTASTTNYIVDCSGTLSVYLPTPSLQGKQYIIKNSGENTVTVSATPSLIDDVGTFELYPYESIKVIDSGSKYFIS